MRLARYINTAKKRRKTFRLRLTPAKGDPPFTPRPPGPVVAAAFEWAEARARSFMPLSYPHADACSVVAVAAGVDVVV